MGKSLLLHIMLFALYIPVNGYDTLWYDMIWYDMIWYDMIWYISLTAIGLTPGGSSTVHIYTQTIHRTTQSTQTIHWTTQLTYWEECRPCPVFASFTLAFALQLRKKHGKTSVRVRETSVRVPGECQLARWKQNIQNRAHITIRVHNSQNRLSFSRVYNSLQTPTHTTVLCLRA